MIFGKIPNGTGGVEDRMAVLWTHGVRTGRLTPSEFVAVTSTNAANIFNVTGKRTIAVGADADIVISDPKKTRTISKKTHHQNIDFNIYEGMETVGNAAVTLSRGAVVWKDDQLHTVKGRGKYIARPCNSSFWESQQKRNAAPKPAPVVRS